MQEYNMGMVETLGSPSGRPMTCGGLEVEEDLCYVYERWETTARVL